MKSNEWAGFQRARARRGQRLSARSVARSLVLLILVAVLMVLAESDAAACHGKGVSRTCFTGSVRLESISFEPSYNTSYAYDWVYVYSDYYNSDGTGPWGNDSYFVYSDWHATAGRWVCCAWWQYNVRGYHSFQHDGYAYGLPSSFASYCNADETQGC